MLRETTESQLASIRTKVNTNQGSSRHCQNKQLCGQRRKWSSMFDMFDNLPKQQHKNALLRVFLFSDGG